MPTPIAPLITVAMELLLGIIRAAQDANEMSQLELAELKTKLEQEFSSIPEWDDI